MNAMFLKKKSKQLEDAILGRGACNDPKIDALAEVGARIKRAANSASSEPRAEFQNELFVRISALRREAPASMSKASFLSRFSSVILSWRFAPAIAALLIVAIVASTFTWWRGGNSSNGLFISAAYAQDNFSVTSTNGDSLGVPTSTAFVIRSKQALSRAAVERAVQLVPATPFAVEKISDHEFKIIPEKDLADRALYRVLINSQYVNEAGISVQRPFSFAFQTKQSFFVKGTLPGDRSVNVPETTGIEFTFSHAGVKNPEQFITFSPEIKGTFSVWGSKVTFVPTSTLKKNTLYTVTISKNLPVEGTVERLSQDYTFQFETALDDRSVNAQRSVPYFERTFAELSETGEQGVQVYHYFEQIPGAPSSVKPALPLTVYRFGDVSQFITALKNYEESKPWSYVAANAFTVPTSTLTNVYSFEGTLITRQNNDVILFPKKLTAGFYLVQGEKAGVNRTLFLAVTPLAAHTITTANRSLVWLNSLVTAKPVTGARIRLGATELGSTNAQGVAEFTLPTSTVETNSSTFPYAVVEAGGQQTVVKLTSVDMAESTPNATWWKYLYTDRALYQRTDTMRTWGFVRPRASASTAAPSSIVLKINGGVDFYGNSYAAVEQTVSVNAQGFFSADLPLKDMPVGFYWLEGAINDQVVMSRSFQIQRYVKPAYSLTVTTDKQALFVDETLKVNIKGTFFDGTPAANIPLTYSFFGNVGDVKLSPAGEAHLELTMPYQKFVNGVERGYFPSTYALEIASKAPEESDVSFSTDIRVFAQRINVNTSIEAASSSTALLNAEAYRTDLTAINNRTEPFYGSYKGQPAGNFSAEAVITEITYVQVPRLEYDPILKQNVTRYTSRQDTKEVARLPLRFNAQGKAEARFPVVPGKTYTSLIKVTDEKGFSVESNGYFYASRPGLDDTSFEDRYIGLQFAPDHNDTTYRRGETVNVYAQNKAMAAASNRAYLYYRLQNGLRDYTISNTSTYNFVFSNEHVPNVYINAVGFDGREYYQSYHEINAQLDTAEEELTLTARTPSTTYGPGDTVQVEVEVKNKNGQPVASGINLNIVDEAFYKLSDEIADPLSALYVSIPSGLYTVESSHPYADLANMKAGGAEGGGCFVAGTLILMADGTQKPIEEIKVGDKIKTFAGPLDRRLVTAEVEKTFSHTVTKYLVINDRLYVTPEHRMLVNGGWQMIGEAEVGDTLVDASGSAIVITSIDRKQALTPVFNFTVRDYHTYIANGVYVHNDKGALRSNFTDTALFVSGETDASGKAVLSFKLPDNLTAWRITAQAIDGDVRAGVTTTPVYVTQSFFVLPSVAREYVLLDRPFVSVRGFGDGLGAASTVALSVEHTASSYTATGTVPAFTPFYAALPDMSVGTHKLIFRGTSTPFADAVERFVSVVPSRVQERVVEEINPTNGQPLRFETDGPVEIAIVSKERSQYYYRLLNLTNPHSDRLDDRLAAAVAADLQKRHFGTAADWQAPVDWSLYEQSGLALLPYDSVNTRLSALATPFAEGRFGITNLKGYFYNLVKDPATTRDDYYAALAGLATFNEPVLLLFREALTTDDFLTPRIKLHRAWAAAALGETEVARTLAREFVADHVTKSALGFEPSYETTEEEKAEDMALLAVVAMDLKLPESEDFMAAAERFATDTRISLEQARYLASAVVQSSANDVHVNLSVNGQPRSFVIGKNDGGPVLLTLTRAQAESITMGTTTGAFAMTASYSRPTSALASVSSPLLSLKREYRVNGVVTTSWNVGDLVEVRLYPEVKTGVPTTSYQITDLLPSGLYAVGPLDQPIMYNDFSAKSIYNPGGDTCPKILPYERDGQRIKFVYGHYEPWIKVVGEPACPDKRVISYSARAFAPGSYAAEPALMQAFEYSDLKTFSAPGTVTIGK